MSTKPRNRNRILLGIGATLAAAALVFGASARTAVMIEGNRPAAPKAAPFLFPALPQSSESESLSDFAKRAFGSTEPAALRAAGRLTQIQRALPVVIYGPGDSVAQRPVGIAQVRAAVLYAAACELGDFDFKFAVYPEFADGIGAEDCEAIAVTRSEDAGPYRQLSVDPGTDSVAVFERFADPVALKILLGLNGQLPTSR